MQLLSIRYFICLPVRSLTSRAISEHLCKTIHNGLTESLACALTQRSPGKGIFIFREPFASSKEKTHHFPK